MKTFMTILTITIFGLATVAAAPAVPDLTTSGAGNSVYGQYFSTNPLTVNWAFPLSEKWWVTAGYRGGLRQPAMINAGAAYSVSPNVAVSISYILETNYDLKNAIFKTQLDIRF